MSNSLAVLAVAIPAAPRLSTIVPRLNHLAQQGPRQEAFAVSLVENFVHALGQRIRGVVEKLERADRMPEPELARRVDVSRRAHALLDEPDRLDDKSVQEPVDGEANHILDPDRGFADCCQRLGNLFDEDRVGVDRRDYLDKTHARNRREKVRSEKAAAALFSHGAA
jgi:hypothetical protein